VLAAGNLDVAKPRVRRERGRDFSRLLDRDKFVRLTHGQNYRHLLQFNRIFQNRAPFVRGQ